MTAAHIKECENFEGASDLDALVKRLKTSNIREWKHPEILKGISDAVKTTYRLQYLKRIGQVITVQKEPKTESE